jgi:ABC-type glutathione transport system ATPase component
VIAHRLSTIKDADKIVVMKNGELVEMGNHLTLLEQYPDGVYAGFCKKQESANTHTNAENTEARAVEEDEEVDVNKINIEETNMKEKADKADALY